jgi:hypothetical protein
MIAQAACGPDLDRIDGECAAVDTPARGRVQVFVVVAQMPHRIADLVAASGPVMGDAGDAAQCISGLGACGIHLADDGVFGTDHAGQGGQGGPHAGVAVLNRGRGEFVWG